MVDTLTIVIGIIGLIIIFWIILRKKGFTEIKHAHQKKFGKRKMSSEGESEYEKERARIKARQDAEEEERRRKAEDRRVKEARRKFGSIVMGGDIRKQVRDNIGSW